MSKHPKPRLISVCIFLALSNAGFTQAEVVIDQKPLATGGAEIPPNIMLIWDDSGSMAWTCMPGGTNSCTEMPNLSPTNIRSTVYTANTIYYNPHKQYTPWMGPDGQPLSEPTYTNVSNSNTLLTGSLNLASAARCFHAPINHSASLTDSNNYYLYRLDTDGTAQRCSPKTSCTNNTNCVTVSSFTWTDPDGNTITRSIAEERQNFANWYHFYRTRAKMAKAGISQAFHTLNPHYRVGIRYINNGGTQVNIPVNGDFSVGGANRTAFFDSMLEAPASGGTPLRTALRNTGEYFRDNTSDTGPWGPKDEDGKHISCRQSFAILTTDGYWNDSFSNSSIANADNSDGHTITHADGIKTYQYTPKAPFKDSWSNTLADVAMYYWRTDLRTDLPNDVGVQTNDPDHPELDGAFWQHLVTFGVAIGAAGTLDTESETTWNDLKSGTQEWPQPVKDKATTSDDLWHAAVNSRGLYLVADDAQELATSLSKILQSIGLRANSGASGRISGALIRSDSLIYKPRYSQGDWSGELEAFKFTNDLEIQGAPYWKASEKMPTHVNRKLFTLNSSGQPTTFTVAGLDTEQKQIFTDSTDRSINEVVSYLRGDPSKELDKTGGFFRTRTRPAGFDNVAPIANIVHSSPVYVASVNFGFGFRRSLPESAKYQEFVDSKKTWGKRVYVGANDGVLHSFNADTGVEEFGYIPSMLISEMPKLTDTGYDHQYFLDGRLTVSDACLSECTQSGGHSNAQWATVLVGNLGAGGKGWFALDITNPGSFNQNRILWELKYSDDPSDATGRVKVDAELGQSPYANARIARLHNGDWAAIFGNGYNSSSGRAYLYVVKLATGEVLARIPAGTMTDNGLGTPQIFDDDGDGIADYAYAGDIKGNLWKFNLGYEVANTTEPVSPAVSASNPATWRNAVASNKPLFRSTGGPENKPQPITAPPRVYKDPTTGLRYVAFGTGKNFASEDIASTEIQSVYVVMDKNREVTRSQLRQRSIIWQAGTNRLTEASTAGDMLNREGWFLDLLNSGSQKLGERVIAEPALVGPTLLIGTYQTAGSDICAPQTTGWLMPFNLKTGSRINAPLFDLNADGKFSDSDLVGGSEKGAGGLATAGITGATVAGNSVVISTAEGLKVIDADLIYEGRTGWKEMTID